MSPETNMADTTQASQDLIEVRLKRSAEVAPVRIITEYAMSSTSTPIREVMLEAAHELAELRAALALLRQDQDGWQDISTAPTNTGVLAAWDAGKLWIIQPCIQSDNGTWMTKWDSDIVKPTHWRPLPTPPAQGDGQ